MTQNVVVGYLHGDHVTQEFHHCLFRATLRDIWGSQHILNFRPQFAGSQLCGPRNEMVRQMLAEEKAEWLWILDTDAAFAPDMLDNLLAADTPIVGALAFKLRPQTTRRTIDRFEMAREIVPTMYRVECDTDGTYAGYREIEGFERGLIEVDATGCHCLLVHREVFEKIHSDHPHRWFRETELSPGMLASEDISFCLAARAAGFPIFVDTRLEAGHVKPLILSSQLAKE